MVVTGKGQEAGEGTRPVGTVVLLPGSEWVTVRKSGHRLGSRSFYSWGLDWQPCLPPSYWEPGFPE